MRSARIRSVLSASLLGPLALWLAPVSAKLPDPDEKGKAEAAATLAKLNWSNNVGAYQLCKAMDRTAEHYRNTMKAANRVPPEPVATPPCTDPGQFIATPTTTAPPLEASGAHSPAATATGPPSSKTPAASKPSPAKTDAPPPLEVSGAHSPAATAIGPPSNKPTAVEIQGPSKK